MEANPPQRASQPAFAAPTPEAEPPKLTIEKFADAEITCLKFTGMIDEAFEGKKVARSAEGDVLLLDLGGVKKISSFGIREWVDFVGAAGKRAKQMILIDCAPKVVDQLNMVANFAGGGKVYSFYAPFRCDYCDSEHRVLLEMSKDFEAIKAMKLGERPCPSCKESMYFDEDGSTYFSYALGQGPIELDPAVIAFLSAKLDYRIGTIDAKLRIDKFIEGRLTYLRLGGDLNNSFPREKLAEGLEGTAIVDLAAVPRVEPAGAAEWRGFVQMVAPLVDHVFLVGVQPAFLEKLCSAEDLGAKTQVIDFTLPYTCGSCGTVSNQVIDVAEHHGVIKFATAPELRCPACKAAMQCSASEVAMTILPTLPKPALNKELVRQIAELRARKVEKKTSTGIHSLPKPTGERAAQPRSIWPTLLLGVVTAGVLVGGAVWWTEHRGTGDSGPYGIGPIVARSATERPAWIHSLAPGGGQGACFDTSDKGVQCVGVSAVLASQEEAEDEASDAAYEGLAAAIDGRISDGAWRAVVRPTFLSARDAALGAYGNDPNSTQARRDLRDGHRAVARAFHGVAPKPSGRYWEAYDTKDGRKFVAFSVVEARGDTLAQLATQYTKPAKALDASVVDYFPALGWRFPKLDHGAVIEKLEHGVLQEMGLAEHYVVLAIDGRDVVDAASFAKIADDEFAQLAQRGGSLRLLVQTDTGDPREFSATIAGKHVEITAPEHPGGRPRPPAAGSGGVNVWDRFGGSRGSGRDDPTQ